MKGPMISCKGCDSLHMTSRDPIVERWICGITEELLGDKADEPIPCKNCPYRGGAADVRNIVPEDELMNAFGNANFGGMTPREVVREAVLKCVCGYYQGYTSKSICKELGLITDSYEVTPKGKQYIWAAYNVHNL